MESLVPFIVAADAVVKLRPDTDAPGRVELTVLTGGPVYLFIGQDITAAEAAQRIAQPDYDLAAAAGDTRSISSAGGVGVITAFAEDASRGQVVHCTDYHGKRPR